MINKHNCVVGRIQTALRGFVTAAQRTNDSDLCITACLFTTDFVIKNKRWPTTTHTNNYFSQNILLTMNTVIPIPLKILNFQVIFSGL